MTLMDQAEAAFTALGPEPPFIVIPHVTGMLRPATLAAVEAVGRPYAAHPLVIGDPYSYAWWFEKWWNIPGDLVIVEQDIVPAEGQIEAMLQCPGDWCSANYHVGGGRTTTGLGLAKISWRIKHAFPHAGQNAARDPRDPRRHLDWISLNEGVDRHLFRLGLRQCIHFPNPLHLHYDEAPGAAG